ncbi:hypothetical protein [Neolewinella antarctica]|uniref:Uncharacterized protein n=1 Tax=Neolewinella antarctica TaxID=442734 RepID=A0ABX0XD36_9BACT|nr:hypothetical protein [Neolewinella antarctica]NJC26990.1 hypothetical protein [Neolewinella antarctica]
MHADRQQRYEPRQNFKQAETSASLDHNIYDNQFNPMNSFVRKVGVYLVLAAGLCYSCNNDSSYLRHVGDSQQDLSTDAESFTLCNDESATMQYFNIGKGLKYTGGKQAIREAFRENFVARDTTTSGWVRVRFIVNCRGESGRFRLLSADLTYAEMELDETLADDILAIVKSLDGWEPMVTDGGDSLDYYQYITVKLVDGEIKELLP